MRGESGDVCRPRFFTHIFLFYTFLTVAASPNSTLQPNSTAAAAAALMDSHEVHSGKRSKCSEKMDSGSMCTMFRMLDADFFSDAKMKEIEKGAVELNVPIIKSNRKLVASVNGGLENPSCLVFHPALNHDHAHDSPKRFNYPSLSGVEMPKSDEDIAFMSILELGQLIRSKQVSCEELAKIFLNRLKRYGPILESVITITEELAYEQARRADELLSQGIYLGMKILFQFQ